MKYLKKEKSKSVAGVKSSAFSKTKEVLSEEIDKAAELLKSSTSSEDASFYFKMGAIWMQEKMKGSKLFK